MAGEESSDFDVSISGSSVSSGSVSLDETLLRVLEDAPAPRLRPATASAAAVRSSQLMGSSSATVRRPASASGSRRTAFVAGSVSVQLQGPRDSVYTPTRDILLPRLPAPALAIIIPSLPLSTRATLRLTCRALRALVDGYTTELTLRPDREATSMLAAQGTKVYERFPALTRAAVLLGPALPLSAWLVNCGTGACLTSLALHCADVRLLEEVVLSNTHPNMRHLELRLAREGQPHAAPPVVQFMVGVLKQLRSLCLAWSGPNDVAAAVSRLAHGTRRLFLDGRPRLGGGLLSGLAELPYLESLSLDGFLVESALLAAAWQPLASRLTRLALRRLHLAVAQGMPEETQLAQLIGQCSLLQDVEVEVFMPAAASPAGLQHVPPPPGPAPPLLMYAIHDPDALPLSALSNRLATSALSQLCLPGVVVRGAPDVGETLEALAQLRGLTRLEVGSLELGKHLGAHVPWLQELRLTATTWAQVRRLLPWEPPPLQPQSPVTGRPMTTTVSAGGAAGGHHAVQQAWAASPSPSPSPSPSLSPSVSIGGAAPSGDSLAAAGAASSRTTSPGAAGGGSCDCPPRSSALRLLEVVACERLDDWLAADRKLVAAVARGMLPLLDGGVTLRLRVAEDAVGSETWHVGDKGSVAWEVAAVWQRMHEARRKRQLEAQTAALAERLARGRLLQEARRKSREPVFVDR